jgi:hypothetical protein
MKNKKSSKLARETEEVVKKLVEVLDGYTYISVIAGFDQVMRAMAKAGSVPDEVKSTWATLQLALAMDFCLEVLGKEPGQSAVEKLLEELRGES